MSEIRNPEAVGDAAGTEKGRRYGRRALMLGGAAAGVGLAGAVASLADSTEAGAASGGPLLLGMSNSAGGTTSIFASQGIGFGAVTDDASQPALFGEGLGSDNYGVQGVGEAAGVYGSSTSGFGVEAISANSAGVYATASAVNEAGVFGGYNGTEGGYGVHGIATVGIGVAGEVELGPNQIGVAGIDLSDTGGVAMNATSTFGVAMLAESEAGTALEVEGIAKFSRSGVATVPSGGSSVAVTGVALSTASLVLATIQGYQAGIGVAGVVTNVTKSKLTIHLTGTASTALNVAWFIIG